MDKTTNEYETAMYYIMLNNPGKPIHKQFPIKYLGYLCDMLSLYNRDIHYNYIVVENSSHKLDDWIDSRIKKLASILDILEVDYELVTVDYFHTPLNDGEKGSPL